MKPLGTVQLLAWVQRQTRDLIRSISRKEGLTIGEVLTRSVEHSERDGAFTPSSREKQQQFPFAEDGKMTEAKTEARLIDEFIEALKEAGADGECCVFTNTSSGYTSFGVFRSTAAGTVKVDLTVERAKTAQTISPLYVSETVALTFSDIASDPAAWARLVADRLTKWSDVIAEATSEKPADGHVEAKGEEGKP